VSGVISKSGPALTAKRASLLQVSFAQRKPFKYQGCADYSKVLTYALSYFFRQLRKRPTEDWLFGFFTYSRIGLCGPMVTMSADGSL
jgi:hypothetical protein